MSKEMFLQSVENCADRKDFSSKEIDFVTMAIAIVQIAKKWCSFKIYRAYTRKYISMDKVGAIKHVEL